MSGLAAAFAGVAMVAVGSVVVVVGVGPSAVGNGVSVFPTAVADAVECRCADNRAGSASTSSIDLSLIRMLISFCINNTHLNVFISKVGLVVPQILD